MLTVRALIMLSVSVALSVLTVHIAHNPPTRHAIVAIALIALIDPIALIVSSVSVLPLLLPVLHCTRQYHCSQCCQC